MVHGSLDTLLSTTLLGSDVGPFAVFSKPSAIELVM